MKYQPKHAAPSKSGFQHFDIILGAALFFLLVCLGSASTAKAEAILLIPLTLTWIFLFYDRLRDRLGPPILALGAVILMNAASILYAVSGEFTLGELLKAVNAFCLALLLLTFAGNEKPERVAAAILEGSAAIASVVSIDLLSTRWISTPVLAFLGRFTSAYTELDVVEEGVRMTSVLIYPNTFATCTGIAVLLALGMVVTSEKPGERAAHLICLSINSLAFVLVFSLGASAVIIPAFLVLLALTRKDRQPGMLILMIETLAVTMLTAIPISLTSMTAWDGVRLTPLVCMIGGAAALCVLDLLAGRRLGAKLAGSGKRTVLPVIDVLVVLTVFIILAFHLTTGITLQAGGTLSRPAYPEPGDYTVQAETDGDPLVVIQSQNREDTMMHTYSNLYTGVLSEAAFTVPEDSLVVWFRFTADTETRLGSVRFTGDNGSGGITLGYRLLPSFIANRLQGLRVNQNGIQRLVIMQDGLKLFRRSPVFGLGIGSYASAVTSVQSFYYYTKYTHNHYVQILVETGVVGLILFLNLLAVSAVSIWRARERPMAPALGAALVFMAGHAMSDGIFTYFASLPFLYGVFAIITLCCGDAFPTPAWARGKRLRTGLVAAACVLLAVLEALLGCNVAAQNMAKPEADLEQVERAVALDPFEKASSMLTYVTRVTGTKPEAEIRRKADEYAARLGEIESNTIPIYVAEYYLDAGQFENGLEMIERYAAYVPADSNTWEEAFKVLEKYEQDTLEYRVGVAHMVDLMNAWNADNMGHVSLSEETRAFIHRILF